MTLVQTLAASIWLTGTALAADPAKPLPGVPVAPVRPVPSVAVAGEAITVPAGFRVERLHSTTADQGSWVALTFDGRGRIIASSQLGPLYRIALPAAGGAAVVERLDAPIGECQGLLWAWDSLYCVANATQRPSGLYRLRDTDGDDRFDDVRLLKAFVDDKGQPSKGREHGPHQIVKGPDDRLYIIAGNNSRLPEGIDADSPHRNWDEDLLLPRRPDGRGHNTGVMAPGGWLCSTDAEGKTWRLHAAGFRNPYGLAFDGNGELFTFDADMEWDVGTSWYRPTRVNHVVSGGEYGWRFGTGKWPAYYVDSVGSVVDVGNGSPTAITFGYGARFPARYQRALFILDWSYGRIFAVHLDQRGASYKGRVEAFASGKPLPVTDAEIGPDGAMYVTTGGRRTQTGLYRIRYVGSEPTAAVAVVDRPDARRARGLRRALEALHGRVDAQAVAQAWPHLGNSDRTIRYAARVAVEHQPLASFHQRALGERRPDAAIAALVAVTRNATDRRAPLAAPARDEVARGVFEALARLPWARLDDAQTLDALRAYGLAFARFGRPGPETTTRAAAVLGARYPRGRPLVDCELATLLVYLEAPGVVGKTMTLLARARTQEDQVHFAFVLRNVRSGWTPAHRRAYFAWLKKASLEYKGGASWTMFIQGIREDALANFVAETDRPALADVLDIPALPDPGNDGKPRAFVREWTMQDFADGLEAADWGRSLAQGRAALAAVQCLKCHGFQGQGGALGPDLSFVGNRFSARELLESIIHPSAVLSDQYQTTQVVLKNGDVVMGALVEDGATELGIRPNAFSPDAVRVRKADIATRGLSDVSMMPEGLVNILNREEILDLLAYLRAGGRVEDQAFARSGR